MVLSCGLIVRSPEGILLAHATYTPRWDIPKGKREEGETSLQAAMRECFEETNLDFTHYDNTILDLGQHAYIRSKDLHLFLLDLEQALDLSNCFCHTSIEKDGRIFPETDRWEWVPADEVLAKVGKSLGRLLIDQHIVPQPVTDCTSKTKPR